MADVKENAVVEEQVEEITEFPVQSTFNEDDMTAVNDEDENENEDAE